jgi:hypothetical protein
MSKPAFRGVAKAASCAIALTVVSFASANAAPSSLHATITLRGYVPVICHADFNPTPVQLGAGAVSLGTDSEFCNAGTGYVVTASYVGGSDPGHLIVDGRTVDLTSSGQAVIASESGPDIVQRRISYVPGTTPITTLRVSVQSGAI